MRHAVMVVVVGLGATAAADPFVTMDRQSDQSQIGGEGSYLFPNNSGGGSVTFLRFDVHAQWVSASGVGAYGTLPVTHYSESNAGVSMSGTGFGDVEGGVLYSPKLDSQSVKLVVHAGLTAPTGSTDSVGEAANLLGGLTRLDDFYLAIPKGTSLRIGASPMLRQDNLFVRVDLGLDSNISSNSSTNAETVFRVNVGAGIDLGGAMAMAEIVNMHVDGASSGGLGSSWIDTGAVSARFVSGGLSPYAALTFPLDHDSHQLMNAALTIGLDAAIH